MLKFDNTWFPRDAIGGLAIAAVILAGGIASSAQAQDSDTIVIARDMDAELLEDSLHWLSELAACSEIGASTVSR